MNARKVNWLFLSVILFEAAIVVLLILAGDGISLGVVSSLLLNQLIILLPSLLFLLFTRTRPGDLIAHGRPKLSVSLLVIVFTFLCMPLITTVNVFTQLFVENEASNLMQTLAGVPGWLILLVVGVVGPISEEFVFRGVIYHGYRRSGRLIGAMLLSALLFGLMHLNFNQMSYAILVGVIAVLLVEGTGSIFYSMLFHICINFTNAVQMLWSPETASMTAEQREAMIETTMNMPYMQALCVMISVYAVISCITTALAGCLYYLILKKEGRTEHVRLFLRVKGENGVKPHNQKLCSVPLIISVILCLAYMIADVVLMK